MLTANPGGYLTFDESLGPAAGSLRCAPPPKGGLALDGLTRNRSNSRERYSRRERYAKCIHYMHLVMDNRNANVEDRIPEARPGRLGAPASPLRLAVGYGVGGAVGGGVFALIQHLGPSLLTEPRLVRWVFLYALLGGVGMGLWTGATRWATAWFSLSRREAILVSSAVAGTLVGAATLTVATLKQGAGANGLLLLGLPWKDGLGGFVGGAVGGGLWRAVTLGQ
jgi:hypothetical protein